MARKQTSKPSPRKRVADLRPRGSKAAGLKGGALTASTRMVDPPEPVRLKAAMADPPDPVKLG
jgi:hypothetical protein